MALNDSSDDGPNNGTNTPTSITTLLTQLLQSMQAGGQVAPNNPIPGTNVTTADAQAETQTTPVVTHPVLAKTLTAFPETPIDPTTTPTKSPPQGSVTSGSTTTTMSPASASSKGHKNYSSLFEQLLNKTDVSIPLALAKGKEYCDMDKMGSVTFTYHLATQQKVLAFVGVSKSDNKIRVLHSMGKFTIEDKKDSYHGLFVI